jgi:hypothetical protein
MNFNQLKYAVAVGRFRNFAWAPVGENGEQFIIEVQRAGQEYFKDGTVFYVPNMSPPWEKGA